MSWGLFELEPNSSDVTVGTLVQLCMFWIASPLSHPVWNTSSDWLKLGFYTLLSLCLCDASEQLVRAPSQNFCSLRSSQGPPHQCYRPSPIIDASSQHASVGSQSHKNASHLSRSMDFSNVDLPLLLLFYVYSFVCWFLRPFILPDVLSRLWLILAFIILSKSSEMETGKQFFLIHFALYNIKTKFLKNIFGMCAHQWLHTCGTRAERKWQWKNKYLQD